MLTWLTWAKCVAEVLTLLSTSGAFIGESETSCSWRNIAISLKILRIATTLCRIRGALFRLSVGRVLQLHMNQGWTALTVNQSDECSSSCKAFRSEITTLRPSICSRPSA